MWKKCEVIVCVCIAFNAILNQKTFLLNEMKFLSAIKIVETEEKYSEKYIINNLIIAFKSFKY